MGWNHQLEMFRRQVGKVHLNCFWRPCMWNTYVSPVLKYGSLSLGVIPLTYHPLAIVTSVPLRTLQHVVVKLKKCSHFLMMFDAFPHAFWFKPQASSRHTFRCGSMLAVVLVFFVHGVGCHSGESCSTYSASTGTVVLFGLRLKLGWRARLGRKPTATMANLFGMGVKASSIPATWSSSTAWPLRFRWRSFWAMSWWRVVWCPKRTLHGTDVAMPSSGPMGKTWDSSTPATTQATSTKHARSAFMPRWIAWRQRWQWPGPWQTQRCQKKLGWPRNGIFQWQPLQGSCLASLLECLDTLLLALQVRLSVVSQLLTEVAPQSGEEKKNPHANSMGMAHHFRIHWVVRVWKFGFPPNFFVTHESWMLDTNHLQT